MSRNGECLFLVNQDAQHAAQWLGCPPQQLIADGESGQVFVTHGHLAQTADGGAQGAGNGRWREFFQGDFALVGDDLGPFVAVGQ